MDVVLNAADSVFFTPYIYPASVPADNALRQFVTLNMLVDAGGVFLYLTLATLSYVLVFDKALLDHPQMLPVCQCFTL